MKIKIIFAVTPLVLILFGCASSGRHEPTVKFAPRQSVAILWDEDSFSERYGPRLASVLEKNGFIITTNGTPGTLVCKTLLRVGFTINARVVLLSGDTPLVKSESSNGGWGTLMARDSVEKHIIRSAIEAFDLELSKARRGETTPQNTQKVYKAKGQ